MYDLSQKNVVQVWREDSRTLMIVFSGIFPIAGAAPFDFLKETEFASCNLMYMHDFYRSGYKQGLSDELTNLEQLLAWTKKTVAEHDIDEIVVVGASSGALPGLVCAHQLGARRAWAFGPRPPVDNLFKPMSHKGPPIEGWHQKKALFNSKVATLFRRRARDWFARRYVDWDLVDAQAQQLSSEKPVDPERDYKVYHLASNVVDTAVTERLVDCPGVNCITVSLPVDYAGTWTLQSGWDHSVIQVMRLGKGLAHYMNLNSKRTES